MTKTINEVIGLLNNYKKMSKIELNARDLQIKTLGDDQEVVQIKGGTAFDESFIAECRENGVKNFEDRDKNEEEEEEQTEEQD